jgi:hypothetical protein
MRQSSELHDPGAELGGDDRNAHSAAAERMRHHRERRRQGLRCLMIELSESEIGGLIREGLLPAELRNEPFAVSWALYDYLDRTLAHSP